MERMRFLERERVDVDNGPAIVGYWPFFHLGKGRNMQASSYRSVQRVLVSPRKTNVRQLTMYSNYATPSSTV